MLTVEKLIEQFSDYAYPFPPHVLTAPHYVVFRSPEWLALELSKRAGSDNAYPPLIVIPDANLVDYAANWYRTRIMMTESKIELAAIVQHQAERDFAAGRTLLVVIPA